MVSFGIVQIDLAFEGSANLLRHRAHAAPEPASTEPKSGEIIGIVGGETVVHTGHRLPRVGAGALLLFVLTFITSTVFAPASAQDWSPPQTVWVESAGHTVDGLFLDDWRSYQDHYGLPITEELREKHTLGDEKEREYITQYFENIAIAYVPKEEREGWKVQALPLGAAALEADREKLEKAKINLDTTGSCRGLADGTCQVFEKTKQSVRMGFKEYWDLNDGERLLGAALTEEFVGADKVTTQYFENAVLLWTKADGVTIRPIGTETAKRLKLETTKIDAPDGVPTYDESLWIQPVIEPAIGSGDPSAGPGPIQGGYKEIVVSISAQAMWAYESGSLVVTSLVSTGVGAVPETVTPIGYFSIWSKYESQTMEGTISDEYYKVEDVPDVMYFDFAGNAIHGAYWHNNFGTPMSHGCINLPLDIASFLFDWAPEGTAVTIIE